MLILRTVKIPIMDYPQPRHLHTFPVYMDAQAAEKVHHDNYVWSNRVNTTGVYWNVSIIDTMECLGRTIPTLGVDVFSDDKTTPGVGCGTSLPKTCTVGQGHWVTTQSCSNLTGMVGANPSTPISGTLYKCTAKDTWAKHYTPYTYPHLLRGEVATTTGTIYNGAIGTGTY